MSSPKKGLLFFGNASPSSVQDLEDLHQIQYKNGSLSDLDSQDSYTNDDSSDTLSTGEGHNRLASDHMHENGEKARPLKLFQYLKNFERDHRGDNDSKPLILSNQHAEKGYHSRKAVFSLENIAGEPISTRRPSMEEQPGSSQQNTDKTAGKDSARTGRKVHKTLGLVSQFRRKSCHCSDCGGISKLETKVQNIVEAPNEQIKMVRYLREKNNSKENAKKAPYLDLPLMSALMLSENGKEGSQRQSLVTKKQSKRLQKHMRIQSIVACFTGRNSLLKRGTETPFRKSRQDTAEEQVLRSGSGQFTIRISNAGETEKQLYEGEKRGSLKKESDDRNVIIAPVLGKKSKNAKHIKRKIKKEPVTLPENNALDSAIANPEGFNHETKIESPNLTGTIIKKFTFKPIEYEDVIQSVDEVLDKQTKKEVLGKVGLISPKFNSIVSPRTVKNDDSDKKKRLSTIFSTYSPPKITQKIRSSHVINSSHKKISSSTSTVDSQNTFDPACSLGFAMYSSKTACRIKCIGNPPQSLQKCWTKPRLNTVETKISSPRESIVIQDLRSIYSPTANSARHSKCYSISNGYQSRQSMQMRVSPTNITSSLTFWPNTARDSKNMKEGRGLTSSSQDARNKHGIIRIKKKSKTDQVKLNTIGSQKEIVWCK